MTRPGGPIPSMGSALPTAGTLVPTTGLALPEPGSLFPRRGWPYPSQVASSPRRGWPYPSQVASSPRRGWPYPSQVASSPRRGWPYPSQVAVAVGLTLGPLTTLHTAVLPAAPSCPPPCTRTPPRTPAGSTPSHHPEPRRRVRVRRQADVERLRPDVGAPGLREREEEALLRRERRRRRGPQVCILHALERGVRELHSAEVGEVLAEGEPPVSLSRRRHASYSRSTQRARSSNSAAASTVHHSATLPFSSKRRPSSSKACVSSWPMTMPSPPRLVAAPRPRIEERRREDARGQDQAIERRLVVGVRRRHRARPLLDHRRPPDLGEGAGPLEGRRPRLVPDERAPIDGEIAITPPVLGVTHLRSQRAELHLGALAGRSVHPGELRQALAHRLFELLHERLRRGLRRLHLRALHERGAHRVGQRRERRANAALPRGRRGRRPQHGARELGILFHERRPEHAGERVEELPHEERAPRRGRGGQEHVAHRPQRALVRDAERRVLGEPARAQVNVPGEARRDGV